MAMAFFREDPNTSFEFTPTNGFPEPSAAAPRPVPLIDAKLRIPDVDNVLPRKWLTGVLDKSSRNSAATVIVGRAGTGKTTLAAEFAAERGDAAWYTIDASDADWRTFRSYFRAAVLREWGKNVRPAAPDSATPLDLLADLTAGLELRARRWPSLVVLDGIHHLFDQPWFHEFFDHLVASLPADAHALMLSRSNPPTPVWRLRSKQVLNVIDEKLLAFSPAEAREFFRHHGVRNVDLDDALKRSFGHVGGLSDVVRARTAPAA